MIKKFLIRFNKTAGDIKTVNLIFLLYSGLVEAITKKLVVP